MGIWYEALAVHAAMMGFSKPPCPSKNTHIYPCSAKSEMCYLRQAPLQNMPFQVFSCGC